LEIEPAEVQEALQTVSQALTPLKASKTVTWITDRGFDEDRFKVTKEGLGWEEVQVLDWQAVQSFVALAWVTAGFLYQIGVTFHWAEVQLLAKLGGS